MACVGGVTRLTFSRRFNTGDSLDEVIVEGEASDVLFAYGSSDSLSYHGSNKEAAIINFFTGEAELVCIGFGDWCHGALEVIVVLLLLSFLTLSTPSCG